MISLINVYSVLFYLSYITTFAKKNQTNKLMKLCTSLFRTKIIEQCIQNFRNDQFSKQSASAPHPVPGMVLLL